MFVDARIPVLFGNAGLAGAEDALLIEASAALPANTAMLTERLSPAQAAETAHAAGCDCCAPRGAVGRLLAGLFLARARGEVGFFRRVVVATEDAQTRAEVAAALAQDPLASSCFRLAAVEG